MRRRPTTSSTAVFGLALALICAAGLLGGVAKDETASRAGTHAK